MFFQKLPFFRHTTNPKPLLNWGTVVSLFLYICSSAFLCDFERLFQSFIFKVLLKMWLTCWRTLREKCPNMESFLVHIFLYSNWIQGIYGGNLCIQSKCRKIRTRKNSVFWHFPCSGRHSISVSLLSFSKSIAMFL